MIYFILSFLGITRPLIFFVDFDRPPLLFDPGDFPSAFFLSRIVLFGRDLGLDFCLSVAWPLLLLLNRFVMFYSSFFKLSCTRYFCISLFIYALFILSILRSIYSLSNLLSLSFFRFLSWLWYYCFAANFLLLLSVFRSLVGFFFWMKPPSSKISMPSR